MPAIWYTARDVDHGITRLHGNFSTDIDGAVVFQEGLAVTVTKEAGTGIYRLTVDYDSALGGTPPGIDILAAHFILEDGAGVAGTLYPQVNAINEAERWVEMKVTDLTGAPALADMGDGDFWKWTIVLRHVSHDSIG